MDKKTGAKIFFFATGLLLAVCGVGLPYYYARFGINFSDEPYQIMLALDLQNNPLSPLSGLLASGWSALFGHGLLSMRCLGIVYFQLAALASVAYLWHRTHRALYTLWVAAFTLCLLPMCSIVTLFGWDSPTALFVTLTGIVMLMYARTPTTRIAVAMGMCAACATLVRLPNAFVVVGVVALVAYKTPKGFKFRQMLAAIVAFAGACAVVILAIFHTPANYLHSLAANAVNNHELGRLWDNTYYSAVFMLRYVFMVAGVFACVWAIYRIFHDKMLRLAALFVVTFAWIAYVRDCEPLGFCETQWQMCSALFLFMIGYLVATCDEHERKSRFLFAGICLVAAVTPFVGSDTGMVKQLSVTLFPVLFAGLSARMNSALKSFFVVFFAVTMLTGIRSHRYTTFPYPRPQPGTVGCVYAPERELFDGVMTSAENKAMLDSIAHAIAANPGRRIVAAGVNQERFVIDYMSGVRTPVHANDWSRDLSADRDYAQAVLAYLDAQSDSTLVIVLDTPNFRDSQLVRALAVAPPTAEVVLIPYM